MAALSVADRRTRGALQSALHWLAAAALLAAFAAQTAPTRRRAAATQ